VTVVQSSSDVADPFVTAQRGEGQGYRFVKSFGRHVERVRGLVQIMDNDSALFDRHEDNLAYSPFVRPQLISPYSRTRFYFAEGKATLTPLDYHESDWQDLKRIRATTLTFSPRMATKR
jgi:hypothetical protein